MPYSVQHLIQTVYIFPIFPKIRGERHLKAFVHYEMPHNLVKVYFLLNEFISCMINGAFSGLKSVRGCACMHHMIMCEYIHMWWIACSVCARRHSVHIAYLLWAFPVAPRCYTCTVNDTNVPNHTRTNQTNQPFSEWMQMPGLQQCQHR